MTGERHLLMLVAGGLALLTSAAGQETDGASSVRAARQADAPAATPAGRDSDAAAGRSNPAPSATNPLEAFLSVWMTARDHALLREGTPAAGPATSAPTSSPDDIWRNLAGSVSQAKTRPTAPPAATTNPYVEAMSQAARPPTSADTPAVSTAVVPPAVSVSGSPPTSNTDVSAPTMIAPEPPLATPPAQYRPPPPSDAKYFPQLKKF